MLQICNVTRESSQGVRRLSRRDAPGPRDVSLAVGEGKARATPKGEFPTSGRFCQAIVACNSPSGVHVAVLASPRPGYAMRSALASILARHTARLAGPMIWVYPVDPLDVSECQGWGATPQSLTIDRGVHVRLSHQGIPSHWGIRAAELESPVAIVPFPKSKELLPLALLAASQAVGPGGDVLVVGNNRSGIRTVGPTLQQWLDDVEQLDNARHCVLFGGKARTLTSDMEARGSATSTFEVSTANGPLRVVCLPGVFSHGRLDDGTRMLLGCLKDISGRVLDLGCGAGVLAAALARQGCSGVAADTSALAVESTRLTFSANGITSFEVVASDGFDEVKGPFDHIVSNPPFHEGFEQDTSAALRFIEQAPRMLKVGGTLTIVANRFLKYAEPLNQTFGSFRVLREDERFRVYQVVNTGVKRPAPASDGESPPSATPRKPTAAGRTGGARQGTDKRGHGAKPSGGGRSGRR
jgi:16S rRNA (guanine1207-N2)-methyltransferase